MFKFKIIITTQHITTIVIIIIIIRGNEWNVSFGGYNANIRKYLYMYTEREMEIYIERDIIICRIYTYMCVSN